jgi:hypothetical protein
LFELLCPSLQTSPEPDIARAASDLNQFERALFRDHSDFERIVHLEIDAVDLERNRPKMASPYIARRVAESSHSSDRAELKQFVATPYISKYDSGVRVLLRGGIHQGLMDSIIARGGNFRVRDLNTSGANLTTHYIAPRTIRYFGALQGVQADRCTDDCDSSSSDDSSGTSSNTSSDTDSSSSSSSSSDDVKLSENSCCKGSYWVSADRQTDVPTIDAIAQPILLFKMSLHLKPKALCSQQLQQCVDALSAEHSDIILYVPTTSSKEFMQMKKLAVTESATASALLSIQQYAIEIALEP